MDDLLEKAFGVPAENIPFARAHSSAVVEAVRAYDEARLARLPLPERKRILQLLADWATRLELHAHPMNLSLVELERVLREALANRRRQSNRAHGEKPGETEALQSFFDFLVTKQQQKKEVTRMPRPHMVKGSKEAKEYMDKIREKAKAAVARVTNASKTTVGLTASDLEHLAKLIKIGYAHSGDSRPIAQNFKKALKRMGISTLGL